MVMKLDKVDKYMSMLYIFLYVAHLCKFINGIVVQLLQQIIKERTINSIMFWFVEVFVRGTTYRWPLLWIMVKKVKKEDVHASVLRIFF